MDDILLAFSTKDINQTVFKDVQMSLQYFHLHLTPHKIQLNVQYSYLGYIVTHSSIKSHQLQLSVSKKVTLNSL